MIASYRIRSLAQSDLESIWFFTLEQWGVDQANAYLEAIIGRFDWQTIPYLERIAMILKKVIIVSQRECT